jgi:hypothetical protein
MSLNDPDLVKLVQSLLKARTMGTMPAKAGPPKAVYQLKITLLRMPPPVWRRVQVRSNITMAELHETIQAAMGWTDSHLHEFVAPFGMRFGRPDYDGVGDFGDPPSDERRVKLHKVLVAEHDKLRYDYDFGDDWQHSVVLEKILPVDPAVRYPVCVKGKRACPPEDVGGMWGYAEYIDAVNNPSHEQHAEMVEWRGESSVDPEAFDLAEVNAALESLR